MSCEQVIIYNSLSTAYGTTLLHLQQNIGRLKAAGVGYARAGRAPQYGLLSHEPLVRQLRRVDQLEHYARERLADWLSGFNDEAESCQTLLLALCCPWAEPLERLRAELRVLPALRRARFRLLLHISPQEAMLEQRLRLAGNQTARDFWKNEWLNSDVTDLGEMAERLRKAYGRPNISILAGDANPAVSPCATDAEQLLHAMLRVPPPPPAAPLRCRLLLRSREARSLQCLYGQLNNVWPREVNFSLLLTALEKAEANLAGSDVLDFRPMTSPDDARALRARCAPGNARLAEQWPTAEALAALSTDDRPGQDAVPEPDASAWQPYQGLRQDTAAALLEQLPDALLDGLRAAFEISRSILSDEQRVVLAALEARRSGTRLRPASPAEAKVAVLVQTYNQEAYVAEALDSILAQQTDFAVEIVVVDDASTDGTRDVIDRYARAHGNIRPVFLVRRSRRGENTLALFRHVSAPYVAICDGDDYFTDPAKLQIQADYLDANPDCALCFHPVRLVWEDGGPDCIYPDMGDMARGRQDRYHLEELMAVNFIQTNSVMYRWRFGGGLPAWFDPLLVPGDWYWHLLHAEQGEIGFLDRVMSVYRRHGSSLFWRPRNASSVGHRLKFGLRELRLYQKLGEHFGDTGRNALHALASGVFTDLVYHYLETGDIAPLDKVTRYFPDFAKDYLGKIHIVGGRPEYDLQMETRESFQKEHLK